MSIKVILASASPRRRELLKEVVSEFTVVPSRFEEKAKGLSAAETACYFAREKAKEVFSRNRDCAVLGADTVVSLDGDILGKPSDREAARGMLRRLSGRVHSVFTGICLCFGTAECVRVVETKVRFFPLSEELIDRYVQSGLPMDKAGAYGIQDGFPLVEKYEGSYTNVVGLPVEEVRALFEETLC
jgi:septum formation protein